MVKVEVVLRNPRWPLPFWLEREREQPVTIVLETVSSYMQEEEDPLLHDLPLTTLIAWTRSRHLTSKALVLVLKKRVFGAVRFFLKEEKGRIDNRIALLRTDWAARGRELRWLDKIRQSSQPSLGCSLRYYRMTEKSMEHPTLGRRRRHNTL